MLSSSYSSLDGTSGAGDAECIFRLLRNARSVDFNGGRISASISHVGDEMAEQVNDLHPSARFDENDGTPKITVFAAIPFFPVPYSDHIGIDEGSMNNRTAMIVVHRRTSSEVAAATMPIGKLARAIQPNARISSNRLGHTLCIR